MLNKGLYDYLFLSSEILLKIKTDKNKKFLDRIGKSGYAQAIGKILNKSLE